MCYKGYNLFTHQLLTSSTNHKGYLTFYSPPYGGGGWGRGYLFPLPNQFVCSAASTLATFLQYILFDKIV